MPTPYPYFLCTIKEMTKNPISIIFAGTPEFAVAPLQALIDDDAFDVVLVISQPDKPVGRKRKILPTPVKLIAEKHDIPVWQPKNINTEWNTKHEIQNTKYDFIVVVAYGQILKQHILDAPKVAAVNVHASLLPQWRGASPMQHTLLSGDETTGITIQRMVEALDAGPMLGQSILNVDPRSTITQLHDTLSEMSADLLPNILKNPIIEVKQKTSGISTCHKLNRKMGKVDPLTMSAEKIDRHVRALVPWPGVRCAVHGEEVKLIETSLEQTPESIPLQCLDSLLHIISLQPPGKKKMSAADFERGRT